MRSLFTQTTTYDPIYALLNADEKDRRNELTNRWRENKLAELNFVGIVGALLAGVLTSTGSWPNILTNGTIQPWTVRACWYCGEICALTSVMVAAQQSIRIYRLSCHPESEKCIRRLLTSRRRDKEGKRLPRRLQVISWQISGIVLIASIICMLAGMFILIWSATPTKQQQKDRGKAFWSPETKIAVAFTVVTGAAAILFLTQQWTLYSWHERDDTDQHDCD